MQKLYKLNGCLYLNFNFNESLIFVLCINYHINYHNFFDAGYHT